MTTPNYTQQDYERDVAIRENAPEGSSFWDANFYVEPVTVNRKIKSFNACVGKGCVVGLNYEPTESLRSLSDIKSLIAMYEREQERNYDIDELVRVIQSDKCITLDKSMSREEVRHAIVNFAKNQPPREGE